MRPDEQALRASIVIVNYNGGARIIACLACLLETLDSCAEVIIVDNASSDGSPEQIETAYPGIQLIRAGANLGFGAGCNLGTRHARGAHVVFLNPDTTVTEGWLRELLGELDRNNPALVTSKILMADDPSKINTCGNRIHLTGLTLCRGINGPQESYSTREEVDAVSGAAFGISRELFQRLGGFDEEMFLYVEDTDLSLRARLAGARCWFTPASVVEHDYRLKITPLKTFYQERNRYLMLLKNFRWATLAVLSPALLAAECISWGFVILRDKLNFGNKIRAYRWLLDNRRLIMEQRRTAQSLRRVTDRSILRSLAIRLDFEQAASPTVAFLAHVAFDPFFLLNKIAAMAIVWW
ncbi:MAG TPA: glycosyltransferase family 2 protein [Blastocatellia bacterium]